MKKILFSFLLIILFESVSLAANWQRIDMSTAPVAPGEAIAVQYLTGLPEIDKTTACFSYNVKLAFDDRDLVLKRNMIDQKKGKGVEEVEILRIRYADIKDLLFGYDAIYAAQEGELTTAQERFCDNQKLTTFMQRIGAPLAILMVQGGKPVSFVLGAPSESALRLYRGIADRAKVKIKPPLIYRGIVKERAKLEPPPPEGER